MEFSAILIGEGASADTPIIVVVVGMVLASIGAAVTGITTYLSSRDKLRFDAEKLQLKLDVQRLQEQEAECKRQMAAQDQRHREDMAELKGRLDDMKEHVDKCEHECEKLERERDELQREIFQLRSQVNVIGSRQGRNRRGERPEQHPDEE